MNKKRCPACGSVEILEKKETITITEPFAGEDNVEIIENMCSVCESRGDFFDQNENIVEETIKNLKQKSVENILKYFIDNKISMSSIERALEIPQRTLAKWKNKKCKTSSTGVALLRFIRLYPWLLEVAENKYDYKKAENIQINDAINKLLIKKNVIDLQEWQGQYSGTGEPKTIITADKTDNIDENIEKESESFGSFGIDSEKKLLVECSAI